MKSPIAFLLALAVCSTAHSPRRAEPPTPPELTHLLTAKVTSSDPIDVGAIPEGDRVVFPVINGTFEGPLLSGTILPVGQDASISSKKGGFSPDGFSIFQTDDGANIIYRGNGHQYGDYVYGSVTFETGSEKYDWLNYVVAVSRALVTTGDTGAGVGLEVFLVGQDGP